MPKKFSRLPENLEFIDSLRKALEDERPKSYGLYVRLFKEFGREKMTKALALSLDKPTSYRLKYFLGVLAKERQLRRLRRHLQRPPEIKAEGNANFERYLKMRSKLIKQMTPRYERISRTRSRLHVKIAKEERKLRRPSRKP